ncbi:MAG: type II toxin-antitoxin system Phd/YefM family antitoxin [Gemmatimonas sp.]|jgi:prevent-host-death family protein
MPLRVVREAVSLYEAKTHLSALVDRAAAGEEIILMKSGTPMAMLGPLDDTKRKRVAGQGRGLWHVAPDFDAPLSPDTLADFEGDA